MQNIFYLLELFSKYILGKKRVFSPIIFFFGFLPLLLHAQPKSDFMSIRVVQKIIETKDNYFINGKIVPDGLLNMRSQDHQVDFSPSQIAPPMSTTPDQLKHLDSLLNEQTDDIFTESLNNLLEAEQVKENNAKDLPKDKKGLGKLLDKLRNNGKKESQANEENIQDEREKGKNTDKIKAEGENVPSNTKLAENKTGGIGGGSGDPSQVGANATNKEKELTKSEKTEPQEKEEIEAADLEESEDEMDLESDTSLVFNHLEDFETEENPLSFRIPKSLLREDTTNLFDVKFESIVTIDEQFAYDDAWVTIASYFAVWDSENINPYDDDITDWQDSVAIRLYDPEKKQLWSPPLTSLTVTSRFGVRWRRWHHGIDLDLNVGEPIMATFDGIVRISKYDRRGGYGNVVVLRHYNGLETVYAHMSKLGVAVGKPVKAGEEIGKGGSTGRSTGPHLHYEVRYKGHTFDPETIYDFDSARIKTDLFQLRPDHFEHLTQRRQIIYHTVQENDNLNKISLMYRISVRHLCALNRISSRTILRIGRKLRVR